ncbi:MAG: sugar ABC transporter ATP-binding protein [Armatimonadota bacterium]|nr:sugar ABC transporter ATP-binding protein [Armatimonadota bacterium]
MRRITKRFPGVLALDGVDFEAKKGEVHAIVGQNGAGKSTLMKILGGVYPDYEGTITIDGYPVHLRSPREAIRWGIAVIYQELNLVPAMTVSENIFLGREPTRGLGLVDYRKMREGATQILSLLDPTINPDARVSDLPVGKQQMCEIAKALSQNARILIMDEPTSALTEAETLKLYEIIRSLKETGVTVLYVSHRLREVFAISDRITVLRDGKRVGTVMTADADPRQIVTMMVGREVGEIEEEAVQGEGNPALEVKNLWVRDRSNPDRWLLKAIHLTVHEGEIVGLFGLLGAGRSELLLTLFGSSPGLMEDGQIFVRGAPYFPTSPAHAIRNGIGLVTEDRKVTGLILTMTAGHNVSLAALPKFSPFQIIHREREENGVREAYERLQIQPAVPSAPVTTLSGGNQQKVLLSRWLLVRPRVLLLDEPTRGVDVSARAELYRFIRHMAHREKVAVLFSSSELPEVLSLADRIVVLHHGQVAAQFGKGVTEEQVMFYATGGHLTV